MSRWPALDTTLSVPIEKAEKIGTSSLPMFTVALFFVAVVGIAVAISITSKPKPDAPPSDSEPLTVLQPKVLAEKAPEKSIDDDLGARVQVKRSSLWLSEASDIKEPFVHTEKGHTFQEYAQTLDSGRETFQSERPDSYGHNLDYLKQDLKKKGLGLQDFVDSFGVSVPDAFVDSWSKKESPKEPRNELLKSKSEMKDQELRQLAQEAMQVVPTQGPMANSESITAVLREILAARTEASQVGLNLGPMDPVQKAAIETIAKENSKAGQIAKTILSRI